MIKSAVARMPILVFILMFFSLGYTIAHNKVVVVPLGANAGVSGYEIVDSVNSGVIAAGITQTETVSCPAGKKAVGGGANSANPVFSLYTAQPLTSGDGWTAATRNTGAASNFNIFRVYAICANTIN